MEPDEALQKFVADPLAFGSEHAILPKDDVFRPMVGATGEEVPNPALKEKQARGDTFYQIASTASSGSSS